MDGTRTDFDDEIFEFLSILMDINNKTSAVIQYKKMGFNADKWTEETLKEEMASGGNGIMRATTVDGVEYNRDIFGAVEMDLGEDAIKRYLEGI